MLLFLMRSTTEDNKITHQKNFWTHEKKFDPHEIPTKAQCHDTTKPTRPAIAHDPRNLAHSEMYKWNKNRHCTIVKHATS